MTNTIFMSKPKADTDSDSSRAPKMNTVLLVEDELSLQQAFQTVLESRGYLVTTANNGVEALLQLKQASQPPKLILLDMLMPKMDGLAFAKKANLAKHYPDTKMILLSNFTDAGQEALMQELGIAEQYLKSKITPLYLLEIVESAIKS